jgi:SAM-dependent methyltransferase
MQVTSESVEVVDPQVQEAWRQMADSGVGRLASDYVLCNAIVGLTRSGIAAKLSATWAALGSLVPPGASTDLVRHVLRYLEIRGLTESSGDDWRLRPRGGELLADLPESLIGYYAEAYGPVLSRMSGQLTGTEKYGVDVSRDTEALGRRCEVLFRSFGTTLVADLIAEHGARSVVDLGCGTGGLVLDLCDRYPDLKGLGLDIAEDAIGLARQRAADSDARDRVLFVVADAFQPQTWPSDAANADFYVMVGALHEHFREGDEAVTGLLSRYADLLARSGGVSKTLLLAEPELHRDGADADFYLIHALTAQGMPRPEKGWLDVIAASGLTCRRVFRAPNTGFRFAYYEIQAGTGA